MDGSPPRLAHRADRVLVMFSGGRDSSLATCLLVQRGYEVELLTTSAGASFGEELVDYRVGELRGSLGAELPWSKVSTPGLFRSVALANIEQDFDRWKTNLILLGAQMASLTEGIVTCLRRGITRLATGYVKYERDYMEQDPVAVAWLRAFCSEFGLELLTPVYDYTSVDHVKYALLNFGVSTKSLESVSLFGDTFSQADPEAIVAYLDDKAATCRSYVNLKTTGTDEEPLMRMTSRRFIHKIGAAIVRDRQLLVVRKASSADMFIIPGGKPEDSESHEQTLHRELGEELGVAVISADYLGSFEDVAEFEQIPIRMDVYDVEIEGDPTPASEIAEVRWIDRDYASNGTQIGSVLASFVVPMMVERNLL
jgi:8-oxo-dGTP pyrophosphatase MutT (NUDIX family)